MFYPLNYGDGTAPESAIVTAKYASLHARFALRWRSKRGAERLRRRDRECRREGKGGRPSDGGQGMPVAGITRSQMGAL